jgi:rhodanese-related sulfurtransferase
MAGIVLVALLAAALSNALAGPERKLEWVSKPPAAAQAPPVPSAARTAAPAAPSASSTVSAPDKPWTEITGAEATALHASGVLFLDARRTSQYREGHVAGSRSVPVWEAGLEDKIKAIYEERAANQSAPIVVYCSGGECEDSHELAQRLFLVGFDGVRVYKDGFPDWAARNQPVTKGDKP